MRPVLLVRGIVDHDIEAANPSERPLDGRDGPGGRPQAKSATAKLATQ
jgi:hypothetical protein